MFKRLHILICLFLVACARPQPLPTLQPTAVLPTTPFHVNVQSIPATNTAVSEGTPAPASNPANTRVRLSADTAVPPELLAAAQKIAQQNLGQYIWVEPAEADMRLAVEEGQMLATWVYAVAASFATVQDSLTLAELQANWQGTTPGLPILVTTSTLAAMTPVLGQPGPAVEVVNQAELVERVWAQPSSYTILPFHELTPALKALQLDGLSPLAHEFDKAVYPLVVDVGVVGEGDAASGTAVTQFLTLWNGPTTNRDPDKLTRVALTGVTALVRATAYNMEQSGILWPGEEVGPLLRTADIAHISNEVSFAPDCPYPNPIGGTTFCSSDAYFALLQEMGTDVVELTGNHLNDWGRENVVRTVEMYETAGWQTFGGGRNLAEAAQPATFEHNGNKIAFVGCNSFGPEFAWATENATGAMPCDGSLPGQIAQLRTEGYLVLATLQYTEFYHYAPTAQQEVDFKAVVEAGATAVSGSQGHHAQGFAFHNGAFIHYGLGNLFFDQMDMLGTRQSFVDTYVIYDGRLLNVELWTGLIENYARPRQMTVEERWELLTAVFQASGWEN